MMTGPGTNTYLVGRAHPILIDTGAGVPDYVPLFDGYLGRRGWAAPRAHHPHPSPPRPPGRGGASARALPGSAGGQDDRERQRPAGGHRATCATARPSTGDGVTLVPVHTPGHASDHLCYFLPEEQALFSGDLILDGSTTVIPDEDGDLGQYLDSLRRVQRLGVKRIYPAHGARHRGRAGKDPGVPRPPHAPRAPDPGGRSARGRGRSPTWSRPSTPTCRRRCTATPPCRCTRI